MCLVARLARFCTSREGAGGESIVYVGNAHAEYYVAFFADYLGLAPVICQPIGAVTSKRLKRPSRMSSGDSNLNRCLPVVRHDRRSTCPSVGRRPLTFSLGGTGGQSPPTFSLGGTGGQSPPVPPSKSSTKIPMKRD